MAKSKNEFPKRALSYNVPIYGANVTLTTDIESMRGVFRYLNIPEITWPECALDPRGAGFTAYLESPRGERITLVHLSQLDMPVLAHELCHATFDILDFVGVETNQGPREAYCYLYDHLFSVFYREVEKRHKKQEAKSNAKAK